MPLLDNINRVLNIGALIVIMVTFMRAHRQLHSLDILDYMVLFLKHRQTIYDEMWKNPQLRQRQLLSTAVSLLISAFWLFGSLQRLAQAWTFPNLSNTLLTLGLLIWLTYSNWQNTRLMRDNRWLTWNNHYQRRHFQAVMEIFKTKLAEWQPLISTEDDQRDWQRFADIFQKITAQAAKDRDGAMLSDAMYQMFDDKLLLHPGVNPLSVHEKDLLSHYVGFWDAGPFNDYNISMIEDMDDQERCIMTKVLNVTVGIMGAGLIFIALWQIVL
ncbi:MAG: hypothetical protein ABF743_06650 [Schleiferilactobacillus perolens]|uniref:hypothetical protein n=1 Tax=Schleiferilactobacillus perolens TaxID=100468 RepID=UPI0039E7FD5E